MRASAPFPKSLGFRCVQNGSSARREEGAYLDRYVTDEQRSSRPIFNATLRAAASWLFFRVARSTRMTQIWALRSRLEKQPTDLRRNSRDLGDGTLDAFGKKRRSTTRCPSSRSHVRQGGIGCAAAANRIARATCEEVLGSCTSVVNRRFPATCFNLLRPTSTISG